MNSSSFLRSPKEDSVPSYVLYSPQGSKPLAGLVVEGGTVGRYYDKATRSQLLQITPSTHVSFLRSVSCRSGGSVKSKNNNNSGLTTGSQRVIILQLFCEETVRTAFSLTIELLLQDKMGRRRIIFSNNFHKFQHCAQHVKVPLRCALPGMWLNLVFDVPHIHAVLYGETGGRLSVAELSDSRRLLSVTVSSNCICRVRRVLGMPQLPPMLLEVNMSASVQAAAAAEWPMSLQLPEEVPVSYYVIRTGEEEFLRYPLVSTQTNTQTQPAESFTSPYKEVLQTNRRPASRPPSAVQSTRTARTVDVSTAPFSSVVSESTTGPLEGVVGGIQQSSQEQELERTCLNAGTSTRDLFTVSPNGSTRIAAIQPQQPQQYQHHHQRRQEEQLGCASRLARRLKGVHEERTPVSSPCVSAKRHVGVQTVKTLFEEPRVNAGLVSSLTKGKAKGQHRESVRTTDIECIILDEEVSPLIESCNGESETAAQVISARATPQHQKTPVGQSHLESRHKEKVMTNKVTESLVVEDSLSIDSNSHIPSHSSYHQTLDMMRERVKRIQALIGDSTEYKSGRDVAQGLPPNKISGGNRDEEIHRGGTPHVHPSSDYPLVHQDGDVQLQRQQQQQQQLLCSSPRFPNSHLQRANGDLCTPQYTARVPTERRSSPDELDHTYTVARNSNRNIINTNKNNDDIQGDEDEDEDEDGFTVNVCLSEEGERPAVVVPAEATALDKKPPVPPSRPNAHAVDRLCFDSTLSDEMPVDPSMPWSSHRATQRAEEDSLRLSVPSSPSPAAVAAAANTSCTSHAGYTAAPVEEQRLRFVARRGRLGEHTETFLPPSPPPPPQTQQQEKEKEQKEQQHQQQYRPYSGIKVLATEPLTPGVQELLGRTTTTSNTPLHSRGMSRGAEEDESSVSTLDYRRASGTGGKAVMGSGQFIRVGSARAGDEVDPFHSLRFASLPPRSPTPQRYTSQLSMSEALSFDDGSANRVVPLSNHSGINLMQQCNETLMPVENKVTATRTRVESTCNISSEKLLPPKDVDDTRQFVEDLSGPFVFDPLLQCCLDLRSNTYVVAPSAEGYAQKGAV
ncbi:CFA20 domain [Trypanosoma melophagium]|uniref:CFA20 domain n=1 Tax=Trypanosoma melophagium TaxID=715481 RepID=UPI00351A6F1D|nr:CFA20 domain [Trypanosoma melophagium]